MLALFLRLTCRV